TGEVTIEGLEVIIPPSVDQNTVTLEVVAEVTDSAVIGGGTVPDSTTGSGSAELLFGTDGDDSLAVTSGQGGSALMGGHGKDVLVGGDGNDVLVGGPGSDTLTGGMGADTFVWHLNDKGTIGPDGKWSLPIDTVTDFNQGKGNGFDWNEGDKLDLRDLLQGENDGNLANYLHFTEVGGNTVINISSNGLFNGSNYTATHVEDQRIVLEGVTLQQLSGGEPTTDQGIIKNMLGNGSLVTD
ncbi:MAG: type I secretion C-terminal target domain-containing protein, partial [Betaproteobacteria bacterium]|nr:type I secretion C-terminal target domain-containing protein [Betaproteobacteria bacterium]